MRLSQPLLLLALLASFMACTNTVVTSPMPVPTKPDGVSTSFSGRACEGYNLGTISPDCSACAEQLCGGSAAQFNRAQCGDACTSCLLHPVAPDAGHVDACECISKDCGGADAGNTCAELVEAHMACLRSQCSHACPSS